MSYCNHCGAVQEESNIYCTNCGEANESLSSPTPIPNQSSTISVENIKQYVLEKSKKPYFLESIGVISITVIAYISLKVFYGHNVEPSGMEFLWRVGFYLLLCPLSFGALVVLIAGPVPPKWLASFESWLDYRCAIASTSSGRFNNFVVYPSLWAYDKLNTTTDNVIDDTLRNGAKAAAYMFTVCLFLFLLYMALAIVMLILMITFVIFIINEFEGSSGRGQKIKSPSSFFRNYGESRERTGFFGDKYTEHRDENYNVAGESRERTGFFGDEYTETRDANGKVIAESRERTGLFGDEYTETRDANGKVIAESRERTGLFGDKYVETKKR